MHVSCSTHFVLGLRSNDGPPAAAPPKLPIGGPTRIIERIRRERNFTASSPLPPHNPAPADFCLLHDFGRWPNVAVRPAGRKNAEPSPIRIYRVNSAWRFHDRRQPLLQMRRPTTPLSRPDREF